MRREGLDRHRNRSQLRPPGSLPESAVCSWRRRSPGRIHLLPGVVGLGHRQAHQVFITWLSFFGNMELSRSPYACRIKPTFMWGFNRPALDDAFTRYVSFLGVCLWGTKTILTSSHPR